MRGQNVGKVVRLHAPDPRELTCIDMWTTGDARVSTAGCFDRVPGKLVTLDPEAVRCHRCRLYLRNHPQYRQRLAALHAASSQPTPPEAA